MREIMDAILVLQHVDSVNDTVTTCDKDKKVIRRTSLKEQCTTTLKKRPSLPCMQTAARYK